MVELIKDERNARKKDTNSQVFNIKEHDGDTDSQEYDSSRKRPKTAAITRSHHKKSKEHNSIDYESQTLDPNLDDKKV